MVELRQPRDHNPERDDCPHVPGMKKVSCGICLMDDEPMWEPDPAYLPPPAVPRIQYGPFHTQYGGQCKECDTDISKGDLAYKLTTPGIIHHRCAEGYDWE